MCHNTFREAPLKQKPSTTNGPHFSFYSWFVTIALINKNKCESAMPNIQLGSCGLYQLITKMLVVAGCVVTPVNAEDSSDDFGLPSDVLTTTPERAQALKVVKNSQTF